jgi:hypothetical protein
MLASIGFVVVLLPLKLYYGAGFDVPLAAVAPRAVVLPAAGLIFIVYVWSAIAFQLALAGVHRVKAWKGVLAGALAVLGFGLIAGAIEHSARFPRIAALGPHVSVTLAKPHSVDVHISW